MQLWRKDILNTNKKTSMSYIPVAWRIPCFLIKTHNQDEPTIINSPAVLVGRWYLWPSILTVHSFLKQKFLLCANYKTWSLKLPTLVLETALKVLDFFVKCYPGTHPHPGHCSITTIKTRMWADAQRHGHPAKYRWRPLFNAAKFGWCQLLACHAVTLPRCKTRWNLLRCPKLWNGSQPFVSRSWPYCEDMWGILLYNKFFSDCRYMP